MSIVVWVRANSNSSQGIEYFFGILAYLRFWFVRPFQRRFLGHFWSLHLWCDWW